MAGMQPPNVASMGGVPQSHPQAMPGQPTPPTQVPQQGTQGQQPPQQQAAASHHHQQQHQEHDAIAKVKMTVVLLKEALRNLMKISAQAFAHSATIDNTTKTSDEIAARFDKSLEEFYSLCDQLELSLRLAYDCTTQFMDGARYTPVPLVHSHKPDMMPTEALTYGQYISTVKAQIQCASDVHTALLDCCQKLGHSSQT
ncbi:mediator of RNA polymerase II transcription subunit 29 [Strongylocentrotus purpuratus]|uniref:Mediator of RNA polymerase II transcription subunit 29 n=1 Tax=Strongylocentrotus purpuratus TaxID=7668 RepID=A0A7M7RAF5_STRPU|nr:mediator of RNA polymerase II transcription subunit 29 [Strongylocentrotus purpuratus]|eukprot:XP_783567.1 PREDICTED: mediator of RNA polymerase II transcription subunit 29 [Strongylocentrotus purpuratus]